MKIKQLLEKINKGLADGTITEDTPIIAIGEYGYGDDLCSAFVQEEYVKMNGEEASEPQTVFAFSIDTYLHEVEDFGYSDMWLSKDDCDSFKEGCEDEEDDFHVGPCYLGE